MLKKELLEKLNEIGDDQDINEIIQGIEDFAKSSTMDFTKMTLEDFKKVITDNKEIKGYYTSEKDRAVTKGIKSYEENTLPKKIDEELKKKSNDGLTEDQIALRELQAKFEQLEKEKIRVEKTNSYTKILTEKGLKADILDFVFDENEELFNSKLDTLTKIINASVESGIDGRLKTNTYTPPKDDIPPKSMTKAELLSKGMLFISQFQVESPDEYKRIMSS